MNDNTYLDFETFCSGHDINCTNCPLRGLRKTHEDCKVMYKQAVDNNGNIVVDIRSHILKQ